MQAYCSVSFALKLAAFCLLVGVVVGAWLSAAVWSGSAVDSHPSRTSTTQVADVSPGQRE